MLRNSLAITAAALFAASPATAITSKQRIAPGTAPPQRSRRYWGYLVTNPDARRAKTLEESGLPRPRMASC